MKSCGLIAMVLMMVTSTNYLSAETSWLINGSYEYDGDIDNIEVEAPSAWEDINVPSNFSGAVSSSWASDRSYSLSLWSDMIEVIDDNDIATVAQSVYLTDVNEIIFDIRLVTNPLYESWSPAKRSAVIKIDDEIIWRSDDLGSGDLTGVYLNQTIDLTEKPEYKDGNLHSLVFALRSNEQDTYPLVEYYAKWDFIGFDNHCRGGIGFLITDFNQDCYVDEYDLSLFVNHWLWETEDPNKYDLVDSNDVNMPDYAVLANDWMKTSYGQDDEYLAFDKNLDGIVDFEDYAIKAQEWQSEGIDYVELSDFTNEWLETNWVFPPIE